MRQRLQLILLSLILAGLLHACGQKGGLYLPEPDNSQSPTKPQTAEAAPERDANPS